jgi:polysaccharide export outer membrane protein
LLLAGIALQPALVAVPAIAQGIGTQPATSGASTGSSSSAKTGLAGQGAGPTVLPKDFSQLRIEPGDLLSVSVYDTPELTDAYRVDPRGDLQLPLCDKVKVQGLTTPEVARLLEATLKQDQVLIRPQVSVDVQQYAGQYVTVLGEVLGPGRVTVIAPTKLSDILAQVGGVTAIAGAHIKIRHGEDDSAPEEDVPYSRSESNQQGESVLVRPGDTIVVPRAGIVYVLGAVTKPGGYMMQEDGKLNVAEALALSGGTLLLAKTGALRVIRRNADGSVLDFALSYDGIVKGTQTPLELQAQDIVYVPMSKAKVFGTTGISIIEQATLATVYATGVK